MLIVVLVRRPDALAVAHRRHDLSRNLRVHGADGHLGARPLGGAVIAARSQGHATIGTLSHRPVLLFPEQVEHGRRRHRAD